MKIDNEIAEVEKAMETIQPLLYQAYSASAAIKLLGDAQKNAVLRRLSVVIADNASLIITENKKDLDLMPDTDPKKDRLLLNINRINDLTNSINDIAALPDPTGKLLLESTTANGLQIQKKTVPLGVVG